ncbi:TPA: DUF4391 domain-containing protein [Clostridium perfringens]|uniref:DUF4391 domain-containing protein n=1 Tax=Clostridium perfringens TaxID=1502 RepID=UPI001CB155AA|nr:DUF4391 domain-containing protein [Clostridium perfringens]MCX0359006.1 DUF4391 domain-containing protein [Clostridium perfringens]MCX0408044.1 DUF4391 domain-containing protein [Clostridium perfringens]MCX0418087.1 DUF4391 domain-containing protein [Clostridium perfringens]MDU3553310.1 DUF4391 domain-containing protein [Clostridium perfringens]MDU5650077.1 DUF4391 domain-containing protein [Clostridium perfringens]
MIDLPKDTLFNKRIPKQKFYENLDISTSLKRSFIDEIKTIYWRNKISEDTVNIKSGNEVNEIQVFLINLNQKSLNEKVLFQIDIKIPYHILFILRYEDVYKAAIGYKEEAMSGNNAYKVSRFYYTDWMREEELPIKLKGLDLDVVYENILRDIGGERLNIQKDETIEDSIKRDEKIQELNYQIERLKIKRRKTKQLNKQMKINDEIRILKKEIKKLK